MDTLRIGQYIQRLRKAAGMTQKDLAEKLHCSQQVYSNYELGQRDIPTAVLIALSELYNVSVDYILGISNDPKKRK